MAIVTPPEITPVPLPAPQRGERATFSGRVDAFITWLTVAVTQFYNLAINVYNNGLDAFDSATSAAASRDAAEAAAQSTAAGVDAAQWSALTAYAQYTPVYSIVDGATYRRRIAGTSALDPAKDYRGATANWWRISGVSRSRVTASSFYN